MSTFCCRSEHVRRLHLRWPAPSRRLQTCLPLWGSPARADCASSGPRPGPGRSSRTSPDPSGRDPFVPFRKTQSGCQREWRDCVFFGQAICPPANWHGPLDLSHFLTGCYTEWQGTSRFLKRGIPFGFSRRGGPGHAGRYAGITLQNTV